MHIQPVDGQQCYMPCFDVFIFSDNISFDKTKCFVSITSNIVYVGVPAAQVRADGHAQILRCIHRF